MRWAGLPALPYGDESWRVRGVLCWHGAMFGRGSITADADRLRPLTCGSKQYRKRRRQVGDNNGRHIETLKTYPEQHSHIDFKELQQALGKLLAARGANPRRRLWLLLQRG
jgi:hypothetical protein